MAHHFRVTLENLDQTADNLSLRFDVANHDDILAIVERLRGRGDFEPDAATALGVGLKLFGEVMLTHRDHPVFREFTPHFMTFMKELKKGPQG